MLIVCGYLLIADGCIDIGDGSEAADDETVDYSNYEPSADEAAKDEDEAAEEEEEYFNN